MTAAVDNPYTGTLTTTQLEVLRWIAADCPQGVMEGYSHRASAAALKTRDLITITGRGASWSAKLTPRGFEFLERLDEVKATADQLVHDLLAAGGVLRVPLRLEASDVDYRRHVEDAQRLGSVPSGRRLTVDSDYSRRELEIRLVEAADTAVIEAKPVPVPERLTRPHQVAQAFRSQKDAHRVSRASLARATRIVHAIATEAETRGYDVAYDGELATAIRGHRYRLSIIEEKVGNRGKWDAETRYRSSVAYPQYLKARTGSNYDSKATGRLTITIDHGYGRAGHHGSFSDRTRWTLEDKLPSLFRELELRAAEADVAACEAERRAQERQQAWEREIAHAKARFLESKCTDALHAQTRAWIEVSSIRDYIEALDKEQGTNAESQEWIAWARRHLELVDPLVTQQRMPDVPCDVSPEELKPFLPTGVTPYEPRHW
jgi:hypothetical protein